MKVALIGCCPDALELAWAAERDDRYHLVGVFGTALATSGTLDRLPPGTPRHDDWRRLLAGNEADAVIVAGRGAPEAGPAEAAQAEVAPADRDEMLKRVAQAGLPALVIHPACEPILAYELDMIQRDTEAFFAPYFPGIGHPALEQLRSWVETPEGSPVGEIEQITVERAVPDPPRRPPLDDFTRDMHVIRRVFGDVEKVSGLGNADAASGPLTLSVNVSSPGGRVARWTVAPRREPPGSTFVIGGSRGAVTLRVPDQAGPWLLAPQDRGMSRGDASQAPSDQDNETLDPDWANWPDWADWNAPRAALDRLASNIHARREEASGQAQPSWADACRDMEIVDSLQVSLRRGRTIQLFHQEHTEEGSFKGIMAVGGCSLLLVALLGLILFSLVEGLRMPSRRVGDLVSPSAAGEDGNLEPGSPNAGDPARPSLLWRMWPVYPFALFLLLQLLRMVFRSESSRNSGDSRHAREASAGEDASLDGNFRR